tara:strand:- start:32881 stop:33174 length:294 start_codon:yes stop_codon:yes gene_type:complete
MGSELLKDKLAFEGRARARALEECDLEELAWHAAALEAKLAAAREVLREVEWGNYDAEFAEHYCPSCGGNKLDRSPKHAPDCKLAACLPNEGGSGSD